MSVEIRAYKCNECERSFYESGSHITYETRALGEELIDGKTIVVIRKTRLCGLACVRKFLFWKEDKELKEKIETTWNDFLILESKSNIWEYNKEECRQMRKNFGSLRELVGL